MQGDFTLQVAQMDHPDFRGQEPNPSHQPWQPIRLQDPPELRSFLTNLGVKSIEYPPSQQNAPSHRPAVKSDVLFAGKDKAAVIESVLNLAGQTFTRDVECLSFRGRGAESAPDQGRNFFLYVDGKDSIIDFTGIGCGHRALVEGVQSLRSLFGERGDPAKIVSRTLEFIGVKFDSKPHPFTQAEKEDSKEF